MINLKKIICWPPLLAGVGAAVTIGILAYITYQTELGLWLLASFGELCQTYCYKRNSKKSYK